MVGLDLGLKGYKTRNALAELYLEQGRLDEAEAQWRRALADETAVRPAWVGLAKVSLARGDRAAAERALARAAPTTPTRRMADRVRRKLQGPGASAVIGS